MKNDYLLVLGASIMDIFGFSTSNYRAYNSTPGKIKMSFGGVCRNIAENSARIGINTKFLSVLGDDECGKSILEHSREIGYNMEDSMIIKGASTPTYLAILDENGEMVSAISDMKSLNAMTEEFIDSKKELIKNAKYVVVDSDNPKILSYILKNFSKETNFILDPVSAEKATWVKDMIKDFHTIKPNRHEAEILAGFPIKDTEDLIRASNYFLSLGIKKVYISLDSEGIFYNNGKQCGKVKALDVIVKNVTGAGDSFVAGIVHGYINKLDEVDIVKFSMAMSIITIADEATIHPEMCLNKVLEEIDKIKWIEETYNV